MNCENDSCVTETLSGDHVSELAHEYAAYTTVHITKEVMPEIAALHTYTQILPTILVLQFWTLSYDGYPL